MAQYDVCETPDSTLSSKCLHNTVYIKRWHNLQKTKKWFKSLAFPPKVVYIIQYRSLAHISLFCRIRFAGVIGVRIRRRGSVRCFSVSDGLFSAAFLGSCFFVGTIVGFLTCISAPDKAALSDKLLIYFQKIADGGRVSVNVLTAAWDLAKWPLFAFILGMTQVAIVAIPVILAVRGFLLAHAITVFSQLFGLDGWLLAAMVFGVTSLIIVPVFFLVCFDRFHVALLNRAGKNCGSAFSQEHFFVPLAALSSVLVAVVLQYAFVPSLVSLVCREIFV